MRVPLGETEKATKRVRGARLLKTEAETGAMLHKQRSWGYHKLEEAWKGPPLEPSRGTQPSCHPDCGL